MVISRLQETFAPVTLGHIRAHGCRDLLVSCTLRPLPLQRDHNARLVAGCSAGALAVLA
jgi:hypothetical protein